MTEAVISSAPNPAQQRSLEERVLRFLESRRGAECIDKLPLTPIQRDSEKADFLLQDRTVVCEVKKLQADTKEKIDRLLRPILAHENAPVFYGEWQLEKVLRHFPNGEQIRREVFAAVTSAVQTLFRKANRQIRATKDVFGLSQAGGALVIANDLVEVLSPEVLAHKIGELFRKRTPNGQLQFSEIEVVWILSETHFVEISHGVRAVPALLLARAGPCPAEQVLAALQPEWAAANCMPYVEMNPDLFDTLNFKEFAQQRATGQKIRRDDLWKREYLRQPYLRRHTEEELRRYFHLVVGGLAAGFLVGASDAERQLGMRLMERWAHLLEELNERGTDIRTFSHGMQALGTAIRSGHTPKPDVKEIEAAAKKPATLEAGRFYTNALGKNFRCLRAGSTSATLLLLDMFMGKSLSVVVGVNEPNWQYYWPILDGPLLVALEKRFQHLAAKNPRFVS